MFVHINPLILIMILFVVFAWALLSRRFDIFERTFLFLLTLCLVSWGLLDHRFQTAEIEKNRACLEKIVFSESVNQSFRFFKDA